MLTTKNSFQMIFFMLITLMFSAQGSSDYFEMEGDCDVQGDCVSSSNYPGLHQNHESCTITLLRDAHVSAGSVFDLETSYDHLHIDEVNVESFSQIPNTLDAGEVITWSSDGSIVNDGWQLCFSDSTSGRPSSCSEIWHRSVSYRNSNGIYNVEMNGQHRQVYCDMVNGGWTLVARFSNTDAHNWILSGDLWYDRTDELGAVTDPTVNEDAMSAAFFGMQATEFRITRTDSISHDPLLTTTNNCLQGQSVRDKIASFGDHRSGVWGSNQVRGSCSAIFENEYQSTSGFNWVGVSGCDIGDPNGVSFFADYGDGDGAVIMIGSGGSDCGRADHGIGITEADQAGFGEHRAGGSTLADFGDHTVAHSSYGLNMWVQNDDHMRQSGQTRSELGYVDYTICEWHQLNKMNKVINSEDFFGFECPANEIISDLRLQGYSSSTVLSNNPTAVLCCQLGGHSLVTDTCVDSFSSADGNLEAAICEGNSALVALYDLVDPTKLQSQWQYKETKGITCCDIEYDTDYGRNSNLGIDRSQCEIISHPSSVGTFDVSCPDDMVLVGIVDNDLALGVQEVHQIECCKVHNFEAPSQAPTAAPTTDQPTQAPTTACYDCMVTVHGRQISDQDAFFQEIESCLSHCVC